MSNREIICIHIGQAGIQIGNAVWELFTIEHELDINGNQICYCPWPLVDNTHSLYFETEKCVFKPRSLMVDSESLVVDEIRTGMWNKMFDENSLISGKEDAASIFAKGYNECADCVLTEALNYLRKLMDNTNYLNGFLFFHSLGGGTGSGLTCRIAEVIQSEAPKNPMIHLAVVPPSCKSGFIVEPYNGVLATAALLESASLVCLMENEALYKSVGILTNQNQLSFIDINRQISRITSSLTTSYRFSNKLSSDFCVFQTNLVPYPEIHYPITSYVHTNTASDSNLVHMTKSSFNTDYMALKVNPDTGYYISCCLLYRGANCRPMTINKAIGFIKSDANIKFVDWSPTGFKIAINSQMPGTIPLANTPETKQSLCVLANSTAVIQTWESLLKKFQNILSRKAFLHWFIAEGIDESILKDAEERIINLISKYNDLSSDKSVSYLTKNKENKKENIFKKINPQSEKLLSNLQSNDEIKRKPNNNTSRMSTDSYCGVANNQMSSKTVDNDIKNLSVISEPEKEIESEIRINSQETSESSTEVLTNPTDLQNNLSSKYFKSNNKLHRNRNALSKYNQLDDDTDSYTYSIFDKFSDNLYNSSETLHSKISNNSIISTCNSKSFSIMLHESILDLNHQQNYEKVPIFKNLSETRKFLSKFCRLKSKYKNQKSQNVLCKFQNHEYNLFIPIDFIQYFSNFTTQSTDTKSNLFDEKIRLQNHKITDIQENDKIDPVLCCKIENFQIETHTKIIIQPYQVIQSIPNLFHNEKFPTTLRIKNSTNKIFDRANQMKTKKSLSYKLSRLFYRKS